MYFWSKIRSADPLVGFLLLTVLVVPIAPCWFGPPATTTTTPSTSNFQALLLQMFLLWKHPHWALCTLTETQKAMTCSLKVRLIILQLRQPQHVVVPLLHVLLATPKIRTVQNATFEGDFPWLFHKKLCIQQRDEYHFFKRLCMKS